MSHVEYGFGPARALAQRLADTEGCEYGVMTTDGRKFLIESEYQPIYAFGKLVSSERIVFVATPGPSREAIFREALEAIAYPANHPSPISRGAENYADPKYDREMRLWMQSVAANALTNSGKVEK